uniref:Uncharacterized protein n=1 Tax=viral metagenome TaxID=1070528 RepID=A0A6C0BDW9_9ZZZZ
MPKLSAILKTHPDILRNNQGSYPISLDSLVSTDLLMFMDLSRKVDIDAWINENGRVYRSLELHEHRKFLKKVRETAIMEVFESLGWLARDTRSVGMVDWLVPEHEANSAHVISVMSDAIDDSVIVSDTNIVLAPLTAADMAAIAAHAFAPPVNVNGPSLQ